MVFVTDRLIQSETVPDILSSGLEIVQGTQDRWQWPVRYRFPAHEQSAPLPSQALFGRKQRQKTKSLVKQQESLGRLLVKQRPYSELASKSSPWLTMLLPK